MKVRRACALLLLVAARELSAAVAWDEIKQRQGEAWPGPRYAAAAAGLPGRGLIVTNGYLYDAEHRRPRWLGDTWLFDGSAWRELNSSPATGPTCSIPSSAPSPRYGHTLSAMTSATFEAHDYHYLLLFGGDDGGTGRASVQKGQEQHIRTYLPNYYNDVWCLRVVFTIDGGGDGSLASSDWRRIHALPVEQQEESETSRSTSHVHEAYPPARHGHSSFVLDDCLVVFGGFSNTSRNDLWALCRGPGWMQSGVDRGASLGCDGDWNWQLVQGESGGNSVPGKTRPVARHFSASTQTHISATEIAYGYIFGGFRAGSPNLSDLWRLDLGATIRSALGARKLEGMEQGLWTCLHSGTEQVVPPHQLLNQFHPLPPPSPPSPQARGGASLVYVREQEDQARGRLVLIGGAQCTPVCRCFGEEWFFNLSDSTESSSPATNAPNTPGAGGWQVDEVKEGHLVGPAGALPTAGQKVPCARYKHVAVVLSRSMFHDRAGHGVGGAAGMVVGGSRRSSRPRDTVVMFGGESYRKGFDYHNDLWLLDIPRINSLNPLSDQ